MFQSKKDTLALQITKLELFIKHATNVETNNDITKLLLILFIVLPVLLVNLNLLTDQKKKTK